MGCIGCVLITTVIVIVVLKLVDKFKRYFKIPAVPFLEDTWWGPRDPSEEDTEITPFKIEVPDEVITDLKERLAKARPLIPPLQNTQQQYGMNSNLLTKIVDFWKSEYNWKERENFLNKFPQYKVSVQGLKIHYLHVKPENPENKKVLPLLLLHGWPGSVREFYEIIPILTTPQDRYDFVFEVVAPSIPGYGFSEAAVKPGLGATQMANLFNNFMKKLGFEKYYVQGGDWGAIITQHMASLFPERISGLHTNMVQSAPLNSVKLFLYSYCPTLFMSRREADRVYPMSKNFAFLLLETGYAHIQATKPDTIGVALNDSPVGLAAYIVEKFTTWTNPEWKNLEDGGLTKKYTYTSLLDNVMIYWITNSITTSVRLYAETINKNDMKLGVARIPITVPSAVARFAYEIAYVPDRLLGDKFKNLVHIADYDGGHFAAFEEPKLLADDIFMGVGKMHRY